MVVVAGCWWDGYEFLLFAWSLTSYENIHGASTIVLLYFLADLSDTNVRHTIGTTQPSAA